MWIGCAIVVVNVFVILTEKAPSIFDSADSALPCKNCLKRDVSWGETCSIAQ